MKKLLIACLAFLLSALPTACSAEEIFIPNTTPQEIRTYLVGQAREADALVREASDAFLIVHTRPDVERFRSLWGKGAHLRHLYRFYPLDGGTRVTYDLQAVNGTQPASFARERLGDYRGAKRVYAQVHLGTIYKRLLLLRKQFDSAYLYGIMLAPKKDDTAEIAMVMPDTPCAEAGLKAGDRVTRFAGNEVKYMSDYGLLCSYFQCELTAEPLTLTIERDGQKHHFSIAPRRCTPEEYADWEKKVFLSDDETEEL